MGDSGLSSVLISGETWRTTQDKDVVAIAKANMNAGWRSLIIILFLFDMILGIYNKHLPGAVRLHTDAPDAHLLLPLLNIM